MFTNINSHFNGLDAEVIKSNIDWNNKKLESCKLGEGIQCISTSPEEIR